MKFQKLNWFEDIVQSSSYLASNIRNIRTWTQSFATKFSHM